MVEVRVEPNEEPQLESAREDVGESVRERAEELWSWAARSLRKPVIGAGVAGATILAAGVIWGAAEAAVAGVAAWAVFRTLKKRARKAERAGEPSQAPA